MRHIVVVPYDPAWPERFQREAVAIKALLGDNLLELHHIGSTSVPGLQAKPVIDMLAVVRSLEDTERCYPGFEALGYECMGEFGIPGRRFFKKGGDQRTHHIHMFTPASDLDIRRHLAVRDYLRCHPEEAAAYGALKEQVAQAYPYDNEGYCDGKDAYVQALERRALAWQTEQVSACQRG